MVEATEKEKYPYVHADSPEARLTAEAVKCLKANDLDGFIALAKDSNYPEHIHIWVLRKHIEALDIGSLTYILAKKEGMPKVLVTIMENTIDERLDAYLAKSMKQIGEEVKDRSMIEDRGGELQKPAGKFNRAIEKIADALGVNRQPPCMRKQKK
jgi:hypothetical protein